MAYVLVGADDSHQDVIPYAASMQEGRTPLANALDVEDSAGAHFLAYSWVAAFRVSLDAPREMKAGIESLL